MYVFDYALPLVWAMGGGGAFSKCKAGLSYCLVLGPFFWECPHLGALPYTPYSTSSINFNVHVLSHFGLEKACAFELEVGMCNHSQQAGGAVRTLRYLGYLQGGVLCPST